MFAGVPSVFGFLWDLWSQREDGDWAASGGEPDAQGEEHGHLWGQVPQGNAPPAGDGVGEENIKHGEWQSKKIQNKLFTYIYA